MAVDGEVRRRRRVWPWSTAGAVVALLAVAWRGWAAWLPGYRPDLRDGERYGVDVSSHQGDIDWERVADDGIEFAYIKASEGGDFVDSRFDENWEEAAAAGLDRGAYHFFTLCTPGAEQAENLLATLPADAGTLPPAVDLELSGNCSQRPDRSRVERELGDFLDRVEDEIGRTVVLYVGADFEAHYGLRDALERPTWQRRLLRRPDDDGWLIWQAHSRAEVDGISGDVDLDVMRDGAQR